MVFDNIREILKTGKADTSNIVLVESSTSNSEMELLEASLKKINQKFEKQLEAFEAGVIDLEELQAAKRRVSLEESEIKHQLKELEKKSENSKNISENLKSHLTGIDELLSLNDPANIKLWLKDRIYSIEVLNKSEVIIKYKLPVE